MAKLPDAHQASTPASVSAEAQSREGEPVGDDAPPRRCAHRGEWFSIGDGVQRAAQVRVYERAPGDPLYRPLRIYTLDPAASRLDGAIATVNVPYEPLLPGPTGSVLRVSAEDGDTGERYRAADLDDPAVLIRGGYDPSPADPRFHAQMVYAVCTLVYTAFRHALGRQVAWGFAPGVADVAHGGTRLVVRPFGGRAANAAYMPDEGALNFGYYPAPGEVIGRNVPGGMVFTALSHDVVVHEATHALLDGLRACFLVPTGPDVLGFHEGFADLVAIFQHFSYSDVVLSAIRQSGGQLRRATLLLQLAQQFGHTTGRCGALRTAIDLDPGTGELRPRCYSPELEAHKMGAVLVSAVFDAFLTVYHRKTERYVRLASGGAGALPEGYLPADLQAVLAEEASQLASQFLTVCIRALDYCPPVDLQLGEFLRAVLTADYDLVPDDQWGYREAWIDAFGRHGIYPPQVRSLAEDELRWDPPESDIPRVRKLSFARLRFKGDPGRPSGPAELLRQACVLGKVVHRYPGPFGMMRPDEAAPGERVDLPRVESIRASRRVGPDGQVVFDVVAEVTQRRVTRQGVPVLGGATVILGPTGEVRYVIAKNVRNLERAERQRRYIGGAGERFWMRDPNGELTPRANLCHLLHACRDSPRGTP